MPHASRPMPRRMISSFTCRVAQLIAALLLGGCAGTVPAGGPTAPPFGPILGLTARALDSYGACLVVITVPIDHPMNSRRENPLWGELAYVEPVSSLPFTRNLATIPCALAEASA